MHHKRRKALRHIVDVDCIIDTVCIFKFQHLFPFHHTTNVHKLCNNSTHCFIINSVHKNLTQTKHQSETHTQTKRATEHRNTNIDSSRLTDWMESWNWFINAKKAMKKKNRFIFQLSSSITPIAIMHYIKLKIGGINSPLPLGK